MKLYAIDQVSISSVQADTIRPGNDFEVSNEYGKELLAKLPHAVSMEPPKAKAEPAPSNKKELNPKNKGGAKKGN